MILLQRVCAISAMKTFSRLRDAIIGLGPKRHPESVVLLVLNVLTVVFLSLQLWMMVEIIVDWTSGSVLSRDSEETLPDRLGKTPVESLVPYTISSNLTYTQPGYIEFKHVCLALLPSCLLGHLFRLLQRYILCSHYMIAIMEDTLTVLLCPVRWIFVVLLSFHLLVLFVMAFFSLLAFTCKTWFVFVRRVLKGVWEALSLRLLLILVTGTILQKRLTDLETCGRRIAMYWPYYHQFLFFSSLIIISFLLCNEVFSFLITALVSLKNGLLEIVLGVAGTASKIRGFSLSQAMLNRICGSPGSLAPYLHSTRFVLSEENHVVRQLIGVAVRNIVTMLMMLILLIRLKYLLSCCLDLLHSWVITLFTVHFFKLEASIQALRSDVVIVLLLLLIVYQRKTINSVLGFLPLMRRNFIGPNMKGLSGFLELGYREMVFLSCRCLIATGVFLELLQPFLFLHLERCKLVLIFPTTILTLLIGPFLLGALRSMLRVTISPYGHP
nr:hypothetical protein [Vespula vulgaris Permutotera-like virus 1]